MKWEHPALFSSFFVLHVAMLLRLIPVGSGTWSEDGSQIFKFFPFPSPRQWEILVSMRHMMCDRLLSFRLLFLRANIKIWSHREEQKREPMILNEYTVSSVHLPIVAAQLERLQPHKSTSISEPTLHHWQLTIPNNNVQLVLLTATEVFHQISQWERNTP